MRVLRFKVFIRDGQRCVKCKVKLSFEDPPKFGMPVMHLSHIRNKRMWGDTLENTEARCGECHLIGKHMQNDKGKIVPAKELSA